MLKEILYLGLIGAVGYGLYTLLKLFPIESWIVIGITAVLIIIIWMGQVERE